MKDIVLLVGDKRLLESLLTKLKDNTLLSNFESLQFREVSAVCFGVCYDYYYNICEQLDTDGKYASVSALDLIVELGTIELHAPFTGMPSAMLADCATGDVYEPFLYSKNIEDCLRYLKDKWTEVK